MIMNVDAISKLSERIGERETGISSHWRQHLEDFEYRRGEFVGALGAEGHTPRKSTIHRLVHRALLTPLGRMGNGLPDFKQFHRIAMNVAERRDGRLDLGMMRQVLTLSLLTAKIPQEQMRLPIAVIGDGWGAMASLILSCVPTSKVVLVNITAMLLVDIVFIKKASPDVDVCLVHNLEEYREALANDSVRVIAICADDAEIIGHAPLGVAINIASMQEMDPPVISDYFTTLRSTPGPETFFYCCNRVDKTLPDGTIVRFGDYPWRSDDSVLIDELCPWHQYFLQIRPPFFRRYDGPIWHRLAVMSKL